MHYPACLRRSALSLPVLLGAVIAAFGLGGCVSEPATVAAPVVAAALPDSHYDIPATDDGLPGTGSIRRYDWFVKLWRERRVAWAHSVPQDQHAVVFLGDSITQGWAEKLEPSFPGLKVVNRGISGDTTRGVLIRLQEDVLSLRPNAVVILIGTNDLDEHMEPEAIVANLQLIIAALKQHNPTTPVILCEVFPSSPDKNRPAVKIKRINTLLKAVVRDQPQVTYVDTWTLFANAQGDAKLEEFPDLLHPNAVGYAKWAGAIRPVLATLGLIDTQRDVFQPEPGFVSLFNGRDLTGWSYRPTLPADIASAKRWQTSDPANAAEWPVVTLPVNFDGRTATPDGRFIAKNGRLVVTTPTEFRKVQQLWTQREFPKNFVLKLEFRATPNTDSGIYLRGPQLQCRDYLLAGPYKKLQKYRAGEWNEIVVTVNGTVAHCTCNGEVIEEAMPIPATGPIGLEGDRGQMEYRRIRLQELP
jgi:lysophospholipase L1-like esterase